MFFYLRYFIYCRIDNACALLLAGVDLIVWQKFTNFQQLAIYKPAVIISREAHKFKHLLFPPAPFAPPTLPLCSIYFSLLLDRGLK